MDAVLGNAPYNPAWAAGLGMVVERGRHVGEVLRL